MTANCREQASQAGARSDLLKIRREWVAASWWWWALYLAHLSRSERDQCWKTQKTVSVSQRSRERGAGVAALRAASLSGREANKAQGIREQTVPLKTDTTEALCEGKARRESVPLVRRSGNGSWQLLLCKLACKRQKSSL